MKICETNIAKNIEYIYFKNDNPNTFEQECTPPSITSHFP